ncbi:prespore-specific transcriptional regulator RsfA [Fictibacillus macauensis ZFHKF-1]|uniref:Prespore-specific transcriptional regulator RsfA n=1 Tax=Fictibacillus macauensis ZFHKF-1 TaxID=1196324 RepID=I8AHU7_9BACL|nr:RsfA family transcriptional regulator [Fictibacillus macauensis]EIT85302.1 prespore-specific transcriptional regulator RsfA [Fictibacillus macauensis ZFHKF-1]
MMKVRQDAWSEEDDLLLAETVLRHVREGSTQLHAFEEVGDQLERTSAAVGFRWNAIVRKKYEQALKIAKKQRKERQRALAKSVKEQPSQPKAPVAPKKTTYEPPLVTDEEVYHPDDFFKHAYSAPVAAAPPLVPQTQPTHPLAHHQKLTNNSTDDLLADVIVFLQDLHKNGYNTEEIHRENEQLQQENSQLRQQVNTLERDFAAMKEDYQALLQIMDRARRMVLLQDELPTDNTSFRMDKNGNLEKMAK